MCMLSQHSSFFRLSEVSMLRNLYISMHSPFYNNLILLMSVYHKKSMKLLGKPLFSVSWCHIFNLILQSSTYLCNWPKSELLCLNKSLAVPVKHGLITKLHVPLFKMRIKTVNAVGITLSLYKEIVYINQWPFARISFDILVYYVRPENESDIIKAFRIRRYLNSDQAKKRAG